MSYIYRCIWKVVMITINCNIKIIADDNELGVHLGDA